MSNSKKSGYYVLVRFYEGLFYVGVVSSDRSLFMVRGLSYAHHFHSQREARDFVVRFGLSSAWRVKFFYSVS